MKVTHNGMIMEGTPEEIARLMNLIEAEASKKPVPLESRPLVIFGDPHKAGVLLAKGLKAGDCGGDMAR